MKKLFLSVFIIFCGINLYPQKKISIELKDASITSYDLNTIRKITFQDNNITLKTFNNELYITPETSFLKLHFKDNITGIYDRNIINSALVVYPNPADDFIQIKLNEQSIVDAKIIDIKGSIVFFKKNIISDEKIDISELDKGIYFIKLNTNIIKFIKK